MDHGFPVGLMEGIQPAPVIFETMLFRALTPEEVELNQSSEYEFTREMTRTDVDQWRYHTEAEAVAGHWDAAANWMQDLSPAHQQEFVQGLSDADQQRYQEALERHRQAAEAEASCSPDQNSDRK